MLPKWNFIKIFTIAVLIFGIASIAIVQFWTPTLYGPDGYLHIRMAKFIQEYGLKYDFHWARYSTFAKNFADKDLLYHLLLIPFAQFSKDIFVGAKLSAVFFAVLFLILFFIILRLYTLRQLVPLFLLALLISDRFFYLFCWPRQMILVVALTIFGIHFLIEQKSWPVFIITFLYCLMHVSGPYMLLYAVLTEAARYIHSRRFYLKSLLITGLAITAAYLIHPNFPNNILVFYLNAIMVPIYSMKWGIELGAEFFPLSTREYLLSYPFLVLAVVSIFMLAVFLRPKATLRTQVLMLHSSLFFVFSFLSQRYIAHSYPFILLSLASYMKDYSGESPGEQVSLDLKPVFKAATVLFCALAVIFGTFAYKNLREFAFTHSVFDSHYERVARFFKQNVPKGELIFHANWSDSQYFIGVDPDNDYFVTLDPIYMVSYNRQLYNLYRDVSFGRTKDPYDVLKNTFKAKYGYAGKNFFGGLIEQVRKDPRFQVMGEDEIGAVFKLE